MTSEFEPSLTDELCGDVPICVAVPVRNEGSSLGACLARLKRFAELVVIDSGSTDDTKEVARAHGAQVVDFAWNGCFPKKRNWFLETHPPEQPWVLFLDADEFVDNAFVDAAAAAVARADSAPDGPDGFWITYDNTFMGAPLRHGLPQRKLALFRSRGIRFEHIQEDGWSTLDMEIHEHPVIDGAVGALKAHIEHRDDRGLAQFLIKHVNYARWEARRYIELNGALPDHMTARQRFKYRHIASWWYPAFYFLYTYVLRWGILDGAAGFHYAAYKTWYFRTIKLLIAESTRETTANKDFR